MNLLLKLILFIILILKLSHCAPQPNPQRTPSGDYSVTHLDIRDAVLSLVRVLQDQMDKLERHEVRERQLGEQLTRSLGTLEKRSRGEEKNIENIAGYIARIDDKVKSVQGTLEKQTEERKTESERNGREFTSLKELLSANAGTGGLSENLERKLDALSEKVTSLAEASNQNSIKFNQLVEQWQASTSSGTGGGGASDESLLQELSEIKDALSRTSDVENKLLTKLNTGNEWQGELIESMDSQRKRLAIIEEEIGKTINFLGQLTTSATGIQSTLTELGQTTTNQLTELGNRGTNSSDSEITRILEGQKTLENKMKEMETGVEKISTKMESGYEKLSKEMKGLSNVESVLLDTGDSVLDTKRRLEYGVQQILGELGNQLKENTMNLNNSLQSRFDDLAKSVLGNQSIALTNLTSRMEEEISQVWRQIGILYHQMSRSANLLDEIHSQTSKYVNNSLNTMDSMDGKVGQITNRMGEVDDNLNYLLGRMSLVVQEFNMIKNGLGDALVSLKDNLVEIGDADVEKENKVEAR